MVLKFNESPMFNVMLKTTGVSGQPEYNRAKLRIDDFIDELLIF